MCVFIYVFVSRLQAKRKTIQTSNFAHILQSTLSKNGFFVFFNQITVTAASLEKLACHVNFPHISSIAFLINCFKTLEKSRLDNAQFKKKSFTPC